MTGPNSIHTTGVVQSLLQHVNAISPAAGKRDKQVPLPLFSVEDLNLEAGRAVSGIQRGNNLLYRRCAGAAKISPIPATGGS